MPLPAVLHDYGLPAQVCCDGFFAPAERMRLVAHQALVACFPPEVCDEGLFASYVTHGFDADDPIGDSLAVSLGPIRPVQPSTGRGSPGYVLARCPYLIRLYETGWPMVERDGDDHILLPDREAMHEATMHAFSHAETMWRSIADGIAKRTIFDGLPVYRVQVGTLEPIEPAGTMIGWRMEVEVDLGWS